jgi:hypothetical protein
MIALFSVSLSAQDFQIIQTLNTVGTEKYAIDIAEKIAALSPEKLRLFKSKEFADDHTYIIRFVPDAMTDQQYNNLDQSKQEGFLTVRFEVSGEGQKTYKFKQATGDYSLIAPFWKKYFHPDADTDKIATDGKLQKLIDRSKNVDYYFQEDNEGWILRNQS